MDPLSQSTRLTPDERGLIKDTTFFHAKVVISRKIKQTLIQLHEALKEELAPLDLLAPGGVDVQLGQFVKGEHLEDFPYQYLDFPKYFSHAEKFAFRSLFWWGHAFVFALILEGGYLERYKSNLLTHYGEVADRGLSLLLAPTLWEWNNRPELLLQIRKDNKERVAEALSWRPWLKIHRILDFDNPLFESGRLVEAGLETFRLIKPIITREG